MLQGGALLMVGYVIYTMFAKHLPAQVVEFTATIKAQSDKIESLTCTFLDASTKERAAFVSELKEQRELGARNHQEVVRQLDRVTRALAYLLAKLHNGTEEIPEHVRQILDM